ncbi:MAG: hypothetical protein FWE31_01895 [Firmicutes bacterium]|nr:hypothetical protein [Bacillota bacterium]
MEFLRKNWVKLALITLSLAGLILAIVYLVDISDLGVGFMDMTPQIAYLLFFAGVLATLVAMMLNYRMIAAYILKATGLLVTIFFILAMVNFDGGRLTHIPLAMQMIAFGLFPLVWGAKLCMKDRERKTKKK